jgi:hypothetical protein
VGNSARPSVTPSEKLDRHLSDAIAELGTKPMSVIDKMQLVMQRRDDFNKSLDARAQKLLERYAEADTKADKVFARHSNQLDAEEKTLGEVEAVIERMSNDGNFTDSQPEVSK